MSITPGTALPYSVMGMGIDQNIDSDENKYWSLIGGFAKSANGMIDPKTHDWTVSDAEGKNWKSIFDGVVEVFPRTYRLFASYRQHQALLLQIMAMYGRADQITTLEYLETCLARGDPQMMSHLRRYSSYRAGYLALLTEVPGFDSMKKWWDAHNGKAYATIESIGKSGQGVPASEAYRIQNIADVKSRGYNLNYCVNVLRNAIGVPRQYWEQLQNFYYLYALALNKVGMASFPGDIGPLASPYWAAQMRDKLSTYGKQCLEANPYKTAGEPYYSAKCFLEGVMLPGVDDNNYYVATRNGTWQRIADASKRQMGITPKTGGQRDMQERFDRGILGVGPYRAEDGTYNWDKPGGAEANRIPVRASDGSYKDWSFGKLTGPTATGNFTKLAGDARMKYGGLR
jgi:hypothetical protein